MREREQLFWDRIRMRLGPVLRLERQENLVSVGDPDVICTAQGNWVTRLELKAKAGFPVRARTPVLGKADGLSVAQRNWHLEHNKAGGISYVLIAVGSHEFFTIDGALHDEVNSFTKAELYEHTMASNWRALHALLDPTWRRGQ